MKIKRQFPIPGKKADQGPRKPAPRAVPAGEFMKETSQRRMGREGFDGKNGGAPAIEPRHNSCQTASYKTDLKKSFKDLGYHNSR